MECLPLKMYSHYRAYFDSDGTCTLCSQALENYVHLFCSCPSTSLLWASVSEVLTAMRLPAEWASSHTARLIGDISSPDAAHITWPTEEPPSEETILKYATRTWAEIRGVTLNTVWLTRNKLIFDDSFQPLILGEYLEKRLWHQLRVIAISKFYPPKDLPIVSPHQAAFNAASWGPLVPLILDKLNLDRLLP